MTSVCRRCPVAAADGDAAVVLTGAAGGCESVTRGGRPPAEAILPPDHDVRYILMGHPSVLALSRPMEFDTLIQRPAGPVSRPVAVAVRPRPIWRSERDEWGAAQTDGPT